VALALLCVNDREESMHADLERYLEEVHRYPLLSPEEEVALARSFRQSRDPAAAKALVTANLRFVVKIANGYRGYGLRVADVIQEGNLGLMKAVQKFDPDLGIRLVSYAVWWIRAYIQSHILQSWSVVRIGTTQAQRRLFFALARTRREIERSGAAGDLDENVARALDVRLEEVRDVSRRLEGRDVSLDAPDADGGTSQLDRVAAAGELPDELLSRARESAHRRQRVGQALSLLTERERLIVEERIMADEPATLQDLGSRLGFSRERARQIEIRARGKLRAALHPFAPARRDHPAEIAATA
jgi:RNA polymerase sigma-32 factor